MMRRHLKTLLTLTLLAALLASCLPAALMEGAAGGQPVLPLRLMLLGINPHSSQPEAAMQYLKHYLEAMPVERRMLLCPQLNQPVSNPQIKLHLQLAEEALQRALDLQEQAAPDADRHALEEAVTQARERLAHWRSDPPIISEEAIRLFRGLMDQAVVMTYPNTGGGARDSLDALLARFRTGGIGIDELIREATGVLRLVDLEEP